MTDNKHPMQNSYYKFQGTPNASLVSYLMILAKELKERGRDADSHDEKYWHLDAATLINEVMYRWQAVEWEEGKREPKHSSGR